MPSALRLPTACRIVLLAAFALAGLAHAAPWEKKTVCTITVNSPDEKETLRASLPADKFQFVELVERGRPDWLASACGKGVRCDVLVISGHYDGGNEFFSEHLDSREFLPVDEMERVSCGASCPGLFSQLKEVYLFGCNTLNSGAVKTASAEMGRSLLRAGHSRADAERLVRALGARHGESSRDRMRQIFRNVPVIYGFSSVAPLGPTAASILGRYLQAGGSSEVGSGRASSRLLSQFSAHSLAVASGVTDTDPQVATRDDVCRFSDDRLTPAQRAAFVHGLLNRDMAEVRMYFDRIEKYAAALTDADREAPDVAAELAAIADDRAARGRFIDFARDADQPAVRARMLATAQDLGWLTIAERHAEIARMIGELLAANAVTASEIDLVCTLNKNHELDAIPAPVPAASPRTNPVAQAAVDACLGGTSGRARMLQALTSRGDDDVEMAQVYFRHQPIADVNELRAVIEGVTRMAASSAQVRALDTLARHHLSDPESLEALARLFPLAETANVQMAIAGILIRSDYGKIARPELVETLRQHRLKSAGGKDLIDALIRRLQVSL